MHEITIENNGRVVNTAYFSDAYPSDVTTERRGIYDVSSAPLGYLDGATIPFDELYEIDSMRIRVEAQKLVYSPLDIQMDLIGNSCYVKIDNELNSTISGNLYVFLIENEVTSSKHSAIPRKTMNEVIGEPISIGGNGSFTKDFNFTIDTGWVEDNCEIVAFVQKSDKEVIQAKKIGLGPVGINKPAITKNGGKFFKVIRNNSAGNIAFSFEFEMPTQLTLKIYNSSGKQVKKLNSAIYNQGKHSILWDLKDDNSTRVARGVYYIELSTKNRIQSEKVIIW